MAMRFGAPRAGISAPHQSQKEQQRIAQAFMALLGTFCTTLDGEPPYLEGGASSRLMLSLRSTLPEEQDFALQRLVQATDFDPELLPLVHHVYLVEALLELIDGELNRQREALQLHPWATGLRARWPREGTRRTCEAGLVLRNLVMREGNAKLMSQQAGKRLLRVITETLELGLPFHNGVYHPPGASDDDTLDELKVYMLEILQKLTFSIRLQPMVPQDVPAKPRTRMPPPGTAGAERRLLSILTALAYAPDRSLAVLSLSAMAALANVDSHEALFSAPAMISASYSPLARALELLPLQDAELNAAALEYLYAATNNVQIAIELAQRPHLTFLLRHLATAVTRSGQLEAFEVDVRPSLQLPKRQVQATNGEDGNGPDGAHLSHERLSHILATPEPARAKQWMQQVYQPDPNAEVSQIDLWRAYSDQFKPYEATHRLMQPADVITASKDAFAGAQPMVTGSESKRFIIRGIRVRESINATHIFRCQWKGCQAPIDPERRDGASVYRHTTDAHLAHTSQHSGRCSWGDCHYTVPSMQTASAPSHIDLIANALALHLRTHIPKPLTIGSASPSSRAAAAPREVIPIRVLHTERAEDGIPAGRGFLAAFTIRNIARAVRTGMAPAHGHTDREADATVDLFSAVADSIANDEEEDVAPIRMTPSAARRAGESFLGLENELLKLYTECPEVAVAMSEIMDVIHLAHLAVKKNTNQMQIG